MKARMKSGWLLMRWEFLSKKLKRFQKLTKSVEVSNFATKCWTQVLNNESKEYVH